MNEQPVRVVRIIEAQYPSFESYEEDRGSWALPANGVKVFGEKTFKTATFLAETIGQGQLQPLDLLDESAKDPRPDSERGIYGKYRVERLNDPAGKHDGCRFFVMDPHHDPHAREALRAYAAEADTDLPLVAADLRTWIDNIEWEN